MVAKGILAKTRFNWSMVSERFMGAEVAARMSLSARLKSAMALVLFFGLNLVWTDSHRKTLCTVFNVDRIVDLPRRLHSLK
jgi:hypothetical protein